VPGAAIRDNEGAAVSSRRRLGRAERQIYALPSWIGLLVLGSSTRSRHREVWSFAKLLRPANPTHAPRLRAAAIGAHGLRVHLEPIEARSPAELDKAFATMVRARVGGVLVVSDPMFNAEARRLTRLA
jgi:hypothetical protein